MSAIISRRCVAAATLLTSGAAQAHNAFGDLGPFYGGLLHPLVDPAQGLMLVALAVLLARQPVSSVRLAYAALVICAVLTVLAGMIRPWPGLGIPAVGVVVAALGVLALTGLALPVTVTTLLAGGLAVLAGLAIDGPDGQREAMLSASGGALGIALFVLLLWSVIDLLQSRLGRIAGAVAGSWIVAIGVMATALSVVAD